MRDAGRPPARHAVTQSSSRAWSTLARTCRAKIGTCTTPTARMRVLTLPPPATAAITSARSTLGNASMTSHARMMSPSTKPPDQPETAPSGIPMASASATAARPVRRLVRAPWRRRLQTS